jgi:glycosyltransferase involved in cell wall biosynthesis
MSNMPESKYDPHTKIAYIHAASFPSTEANTFDAVWTASALAERLDTTFIVPRLKSTREVFRQYYEIPDSRLSIQSLYLNLLPDTVLLMFRSYYEYALSLYLRFHPKWAGFRGKKILYVREPRELLFWGMQKQKQKWLKDWFLCYEAHDPLGLDPNKFQGLNPFELKDGPEAAKAQAVLQAARNFDLIICNTQVLADDIKSWTNGVLQTHFIAIASPLPRLPAPPSISSFGDKVTLGYIGTIDRFRGVNILLEAMRFLPQRYTLRIVGRLRREDGVDPKWLDQYMSDPQIGARVDLNIVDSIQDVAGEIDRCDIVIQPASNDVLDSRYAAPLKSYGYMVRGKPIVAGDVSCHRELFQDGRIAALYTLDPQSLADCILDLAAHPGRAEEMARGVWEQSAGYNLTRRVDEILTLVNLASQGKA